MSRFESERGYMRVVECQAVVLVEPLEDFWFYQIVGAEFAAVEVDVGDWARGQLFDLNFNQENWNPRRFRAY